MTPVNSEFSDGEFLARTIYHSSQYSNKHGLKKTRLYPKFSKPSRDFPDRHTCRVSVQRLCYGGWPGVVKYAEAMKHPTQELKGFAVAAAGIVRQFGFELESAASNGNPLHAHIYIREIDLPYEADRVMPSDVRRKLDEMTELFIFNQPEDFTSPKGVMSNEACTMCLNADR